MFYIVLYSGTCLIRHTKGPEKCIRLYRILEFSGFISVNRNTLGPYIFVGCHRMSENSGVGLHKFHCTFIKYLHGGTFIYVHIFLQMEQPHKNYEVI